MVAGLTAFDILVLAVLIAGAIRGLSRGFVAEVISLAALLFALFALNRFHTPLTLWLADKMDNESAAAMSAFLILLFGIWGMGKTLAVRLGASVRDSAVGVFDRLLGGGFGLIKGVLLATSAYMLFTLGYDMMFGAASPRPAWVSEGRTFPMIRASSAALSEVVADRISARHETTVGPTSAP